MTLTDIKAHIKNKTFDPFYVFTGPEREILKIYLHQMANAMNADIKILDSITELANSLKQSRLVTGSTLLVLFDEKEFIQSEKLQQLVAKPVTSQRVCVVFVYSNLDKRTKFYKQFSDKIVVFDYLTPSVLTKYIQKVLPLSDSSCKSLIEACENDYGRILMEIDKIKQYASLFNQSYDSALRQLLSDGGIYVAPADAVFDFVDAVMRNKRNLAIHLLQESYQSGEATLVLLANLYNSAKQVLQVQTYNGDNLAQASGLTPFQIMQAKKRKAVYRDEDVVRLMRLVRFAEAGIKSGEIPEENAVMFALISFWRF